MGHQARLIPAQYEKPFVKTNKSDANDAEAIVEAAVRPNMRFVPIKEQEHQEELREIMARITKMDQKLQAVFKAQPMCQLLETIPGVGA